jgi:isocitrate dehydrogenase (NAD+)
MLRHIEEHEAAERLEKALAQVIAEGVHVTYDLKPFHEQASAVGTQEMAEEIINKIRRG